MYDVIVVGARCAGSPLAMLLARKGHSVLVVDRATFPSDTLSTHFLTAEGTAMLKAWGLLDRVMASGVPPILDMRMMIGGVRMPADGAEPPPICPRRTVIDAILVEAAREAGVEVREAFTVDELIMEGGRVTGVRGHGRDHVPVTETATIVVGADGKDSFVARSVGAGEYNAVEPTTCGYYSYWSGFERKGVELYLGGKRALFVFPTNDGLTCLGMERPAAEFAQIRKDPEGEMQRSFDTVPGLGERMRKARRAEKVMGFAGLRSFYRKPFGPGWALAGDAGFTKDPLMGQGMTDAFRDADLLAGAVDAGLSGHQPMDEALAGFETARNAATAMIYQLTNMLAADLDPTPQLVQMMAMGPPAQAQPAG
jgi:2-polyprenyl-6-methoxyphenol hydroxylase-like FAD-dependent oxidoreductase